MQLGPPPIPAMFNWCHYSFCLIELFDTHPKANYRTLQRFDLISTCRILLQFNSTHAFSRVTLKQASFGAVKAVLNVTLTFKIDGEWAPNWIEGAEASKRTIIACSFLNPVECPWATGETKRSKILLVYLKQTVPRSWPETRICSITSKETRYLSYLSCFHLMPLRAPIPYQPSLVPYRINEHPSILAPPLETHLCVPLLHILAHSPSANWVLAPVLAFSIGHTQR